MRISREFSSNLTESNSIKILNAGTRGRPVSAFDQSHMVTATVTFGLGARWHGAATEISPCPANGTGRWPGIGQRRRQRAPQRLRFSVRLSGAGYDFRYEKGARLFVQDVRQEP